MSMVIPCPICDYTTGEVSETLGVELIKIHALIHTQTTKGDKAKIDRPKLSFGCTSENFVYFTKKWKSYKKMAHLQASEYADHLLACCDEDLDKAIHQEYEKEINEISEADLLQLMEKIAVRKEKQIVARVCLLNMKQERDEPGGQYARKLKGQASICKYYIKHKCTCGIENKIDFSSEIIKDVLARGLYDTDIQLELLGNVDQEMSLEDTISFIETKEGGKASASSIASNQNVNAVKSTYKRADNRQDHYRNNNSKNTGQPAKTRAPWTDSKPASETKCRSCGKRGHRSYTYATCQAYGRTCQICKGKNHFTHMCMKFTRHPTSTSALETNQDLLTTDQETQSQMQSCDSVFLNE